MSQPCGIEICLLVVLRKKSMLDIDLFPKLLESNHLTEKRDIFFRDCALQFSARESSELYLQLYVPALRCRLENSILVKDKIKSLVLLSTGL